MRYRLKAICNRCQETNTILLLEDSPLDVCCKKCGEPIGGLSIDEIKGFVYVLSNPSMVGLVKIGCTDKTVRERAIELHSTGVPEPFVVEAFFAATNPLQLESKVHKHFSQYRKPGREYFAIDSKTAIRGIMDVSGDKPVYCRLPFDSVVESKIPIVEKLASGTTYCRVCMKNRSGGGYNSATHLYNGEPICKFHLDSIAKT